MMKLIKRYNDMVDRKPIITKCVSAFFVFALGDYLCQEMENRMLHLSDKICWKRMLKQGSFGVVAAPYIHFSFCKVIPYLFPENKKYSFWWSLLYAVTISDGLFNYAFFIYMDYANTKPSTDKDIVKSIKSKDVLDKWIPTQIMNLKVWPFMTGFNFYFMPMQLRVLVDNLFCIFWNIYLSYIENNTGKNSKENNNQNELKKVNLKELSDLTNVNKNSDNKQEKLLNDLKNSRV